MIELQTLAKVIEDGLNTNNFGLTYAIFADASEYEKAINGRVASDRKRFTNGLLQIVSSSVVPVQNLIVATQSARLEVAVQLPSAETDEAVISAHRAVLDAYFQSTPLQQLSDGKRTYSVSSVYSLAATGVVQAEAPLGTYMTFVVNVNYSFVQNGLNSSQFHVTLDGTALGYTDVGISRTPTMDAGTYCDEIGAAKNVANSTALSFTIRFPATNDNNTANTAVESFLYGGDMQTVHTLTLSIDGKDGERSHTYKVLFGETSVTVDGLQNAGYTVTFVEAADI